MGKISGRIIQISAYILITVAVGFLIGITRECSHLHTSDKIGYSQGDTIDVAILYGPESLYLYTDSLTGINHDILNYFSDDNKIPVKIWPVSDISESMKMIESGAYDLMASVPLDNSIKERFLTSESIFLDKLVLIQNKDSVTGETIINSSLDLTGKSINIAAGSPAAQRLKNLSQEIGGEIQVIEEDNISDELLALKVASGDVPFAVVNERIARNIAKKYPNLSFDNPISFTQFQVWIFNPEDNDLYEKFNSWFESFRNGYDYNNILNKFAE